MYLRRVVAPRVLGDGVRLLLLLPLLLRPLLLILHVKAMRTRLSFAGYAKYEVTRPHRIFRTNVNRRGGRLKLSARISNSRMK